jgi:hypothetical protein
MPTDGENPRVEYWISAGGEVTAKVMRGRGGSAERYHGSYRTDPVDPSVLIFRFDDKEEKYRQRPGTDILDPVTD